MKNDTKSIWIIVIVLIAVTTATCCEATGQQRKNNSIPWYFIAIHNEPYNHEWNQFFIEESYEILKEMIDKADVYQIKLTIMLAPSWADYILSDKKRIMELERWKKSGHEIAGHHHDVWHGNWDGYSTLSRQEAEASRERVGGHNFESCYGSETYYGTLTDFTAKLRLLNPAIKAGCMNDRPNKNALPDAIIYNTCSGFANYGEPGRAESDTNPEKGKNEYISVGTYNDIERKWLTHHFMEEARGAINIFSSMRSGVYGTANHSSPRELQTF